MRGLKMFCVIIVIFAVGSFASGSGGDGNTLRKRKSTLCEGGEFNVQKASSKSLNIGGYLSFKPDLSGNVSQGANLGKFLKSFGVRAEIEGPKVELAAITMGDKGRELRIGVAKMSSAMVPGSGVRLGVVKGHAAMAEVRLGAGKYNQFRLQVYGTEFHAKLNQGEHGFLSIPVPAASARIFLASGEWKFMFAKGVGRDHAIRIFGKSRASVGWDLIPTPDSLRRIPLGPFGNLKTKGTGGITFGFKDKYD